MISIGVYDSGVGGLSILEALQKHADVSLADEKKRYIYLCDNLHYPYGTKSESDLIDFVSTTVKKFVSTYDLDILVIACNTASTVVLPYIRDILTLPIIGVVPAIKPACMISKTKHVGLVATQATITRPSLDELIQLYGNGCSIVRVGSSLLVEISERKFRNHPVDESLIEQEIKPILNDKLIDTVVLGCTHFVHLKDNFEHIFQSRSKPVTVIDSSEGVSSHCIDVIQKRVLPKLSQKSEPKTLDKSKFVLYDKNLEDSIFLFTLKNDFSLELIQSYLDGKFCVSFI